MPNNGIWAVEYIMIFAENLQAVDTDHMEIMADHHRFPRMAIVAFIADGAFEY